MQGLPDIRTIDDFLDGNASERFPQSKTMASHNKGKSSRCLFSFWVGVHAPSSCIADGYERRTELYLVENIRHGFGLED